MYDVTSCANLDLNSGIGVTRQGPGGMETEPSLCFMLKNRTTVQFFDSIEAILLSQLHYPDVSHLMYYFLGHQG